MAETQTDNYRELEVRQYDSLRVVLLWSETAEPSLKVDLIDVDTEEITASVPVPKGESAMNVFNHPMKYYVEEPAGQARAA